MTVCFEEKEKEIQVFTLNRNRHLFWNKHQVKSASSTVRTGKNNRRWGTARKLTGLPIGKSESACKPSSVKHGHSSEISVTRIP